MADALHEIVDAARLARGDTGRRRQFTISRTAALIKARLQSTEPWAWTLPLLRSAVALSPGAVARLEHHERAGEPVVRIALDLPDRRIDHVDIAGLLGESLVAEAPLADAAAAFRTRLGRAINLALGHEYPWLEVTTPFGARRFERRPPKTPDADPYAERLLGNEANLPGVVVDFAPPKRSRLVSWVSGQREAVEEIAALWRSRLRVSSPGEVVAIAIKPQKTLELGHVAHWGPAEGGSVWLVREGVRILALDTLLVARGLDVAALSGWVEDEHLSLTVDDASVVENESLEELVAWLHEVAHPGDPALEAPWMDELEEGETLYTWRHQADRVPEEMRDNVLALTPPELEVLRTRRPDLDLLPLGALGPVASLPRADFTGLAQGSFEPVAIAVEPFPGEPKLELRVRGFVHRHRIGEQGATVVLGWGRAIARLTDAPASVPGVTLVVEVLAVDGLSATALLGDTVASVAAHVRQAVFARLGELAGPAIAEAGSDRAWDVPLVRLLVEQAPSLGLRYAAADGLRLTWQYDALAELTVAQDRQGEPVTLGDALTMYRDGGALVVADERRTWFTLETDDGPFRTLLPTPDGAQLITRVLGESALLEMPVVAAALPQPRPVAEQRHLRLDAAELDRLRPQRTTAARARLGLLGHLLYSIATDSPTSGLERVPLFTRYDPRAHRPRQWVALADVSDPIAPPQAGHRGLTAPIIEATPGEAALLHEVLSLPAATLDVNADRRPTPGPTEPQRRRLDQAKPPLLRIALADPRAAGALWWPGTSIALWAKGLRVGEFKLPSPLRSIGGRLRLTEAGIDGGYAGVFAAAVERAEELARNAADTVALMPPESEDRQSLRRFVASLEQPTSAQAPAPVLPAALPADLTSLIRHALGRPVQVETAWLSWTAVTVKGTAVPGRLELGRRHDAIGRALSDSATLADATLAAMLVITLASRPLGVDPTLALRRLLATLQSLDS